MERTEAGSGCIMNKWYSYYHTYIIEGTFIVELFSQMTIAILYCRNHRDYQNSDRRSDNDYEMEQSESCAMTEDSKEFIELSEDFIDPLETDKETNSNIHNRNSDNTYSKL